MGGRNSKQKKYEVSEENVISDEDSSDDDFIEDNNFINAPNNKYKIKATKLLQKFCRKNLKNLMKRMNPQL